MIFTSQQTEHVAYMGDRRSADRILARKLERKRQPRTPRSRWEEILKWTLKKQDGRSWAALIQTRRGEEAGYCRPCNETLGSIKCWKYLD